MVLIYILKLIIKMIKKTFKDFISILESQDDEDESSLDFFIKSKNPKSWEKNINFFKKFNSAIAELPRIGWTRIAQAGYRQLQSDEAWREINNELESVGLTWKDVENNKEFIKENMDVYSSVNAYVDIMLWSLFPNYSVGGEVSEGFYDDLEEVKIKYSYGYHKTTYGRIFLQRWYGGVDEFKKKFARYLLEMFCNNISHLIKNYRTVTEELEEEEGLVYLHGDYFEVYFEKFYIISKPLKDNISYEKLKELFINFIDEIDEDLLDDLEDNDDIIKIHF
jgi:hypothetical protein